MLPAASAFKPNNQICYEHSHHVAADFAAFEIPVLVRVFLICSVATPYPTKPSDFVGSPDDPYHQGGDPFGRQDGLHDPYQ